MKNTHQSTRFVTSLAAAAMAVGSLFAAAMVRAQGSNVMTTITVVGKDNAAPPEVHKGEVEVTEDKQHMQVVNLRRSEKLYLAVLVDDGLITTVANQWKDVKAFLNSQPGTTYIAVGYSRNGSVQVAQDFTTDHEQAGKALRIPIGSQAFSSPYLALQDWIKRWPVEGSERRSILLISSGIDYFRGIYDIQDPDVDTTIEMAQKKNINIWSIYYPTVGHVSRRTYPNFVSNYFLQRVSPETGAEFFWQPNFDIEPVSLIPYLNELRDHLANQYVLMFLSNEVGGKKGKLVHVQVRSAEVPGIEFLAPSKVFVPPVK